MRFTLSLKQAYDRFIDACALPGRFFAHDLFNFRRQIPQCDRFHVIDARSEDPVKAAIKLTEGGVDKAFEAIGNPKTSDQIIQATRPGGTATIIGGLGSGPFTISSGNFVTREITITGVSSRQANDVEEVFQMAMQGRIELKDLITKSYGYDEINEALADLGHGKLRMAVSLWN